MFYLNQIFSMTSTKVQMKRFSIKVYHYRLICMVIPKSLVYRFLKPNILSTTHGTENLRKKIDHEASKKNSLHKLSKTST